MSNKKRSKTRETIKKGSTNKPEKLISQTKCNYGSVYYEKKINAFSVIEEIELHLLAR